MTAAAAAATAAATACAIKVSWGGAQGGDVLPLRALPQLLQCRAAAAHVEAAQTVPEGKHHYKIRKGRQVRQVK